MKKLLSIVLTLALVLTCSAALAEYTQTTILYDSTCTETSTSGIGSQKMVDYIQTTSDGVVTVDAHSNYSLFPQDQIIPAVMTGQLQMSATTAAYMADYMPKLKVLASAYLFSSFNHWKTYYSSEDWMALTDEIAAETGIRVIGVSNKGGRTINLKDDRKVLTRADLEGVKLRMPNSDSWLFLGEALGGNPIPVVGGEIYTAMQTGAVDAQENPVGNTYDMGLYEVTKSVTLTNHMYLEDWFIVNEAFWQSLNAETQQLLRDAVAEGYGYVTSTCWDELENQKAMITEKYGITFYDMTDEERGAYRAEVLQYYFDKGQAADWDMDLYDVIQSYA